MKFVNKKVILCFILFSVAFGVKLSRFLGDAVVSDDNFDLNVKKKSKYKDYNHDFEHYSLEDLKKRIYEHLIPEHVNYDFE